MSPAWIRLCRAPAPQAGCDSPPIALRRFVQRRVFVEDPDEVARGADALLLLTEWKEYRELDWKRIYREMARPLVMDARNMLAPAKMKELGFEYYSFGRPDLSTNTALVFS